MATVGERIDSAIDTAGEAAGNVGNLLSQQVDRLVTSAKDLTTPKPSIGRIVHYRSSFGTFPAMIVVATDEHLLLQVITAVNIFPATVKTATPVDANGTEFGWFWPPRV